MFQRVAAAVLLVSLAAPAVCVAAPAATPAPDSAIRLVFVAWLAAFDSGDAATIMAFYGKHQAERDLRMMKLRMKISSGFRSIEGAVDFATIRGSLSTARKQGWNIIDALRQNPEELAKTLTLA
jgi:hypothetical protein